MRRFALSVRTAFACVALGALLAPSWAAPETLEEAWQRAVDHDYGLAAASADLEAARSGERSARAARWPQLTANAGYTRFDVAPRFDFALSGSSLQVPIFSSDDYASAGVQMQLPLYTGGRITAGIEAAELASRGASAAQQTTRASLRMAVAESYVEVLRARRLRQTAGASVASLRAHAGDVGSLVERELVARNDLLAAQVALANAEQERVRTDNNVTLAYAAYNRYLGEPLDRIVELEETVPTDAALATQPLEALIQHALASRSEPDMLAAQADSLARQGAAERASLLPQFALSAGYTYFENEILDRKDFSTIGIGVTWNLFDGGQVRNRSAALSSASRAVRSRLDDLRTRIELEVRQAWLGIREAGARVNASREAIAQADENLRITRELYGTGLGTNTQVLDAVALHTAAVNNLDNAVLDEALAHLRLARAAGTL